MWESVVSRTRVFARHARLHAARNVTPRVMPGDKHLSFVRLISPGSFTQESSHFNSSKNNQGSEKFPLNVLSLSRKTIKSSIDIWQSELWASQRISKSPRKLSNSITNLFRNLLNTDKLTPSVRRNVLPSLVEVE